MAAREGTFSCLENQVLHRLESLPLTTPPREEKETHSGALRAQSGALLRSRGLGARCPS